MAQFNAPIPPLVSGVDDIDTPSDEVDRGLLEQPGPEDPLAQLDAFYEDLSSMDDLEVDEEPDYEELSAFAAPLPAMEAGREEGKVEVTPQEEVTEARPSYRKQLLATAVASNMLGVAMGFGGGQLWTTGPGANLPQAQRGLPAVVAVPLLTQEDEAPAPGGTGEPNRPGGLLEVRTPMVPLPDFPEPTSRLRAADPPAALGLIPEPSEDLGLMAAARQGSPASGSKPAPPPVTVAPPPALREPELGTTLPSPEVAEEPAEPPPANAVAEEKLIEQAPAPPPVRQAPPVAPIASPSTSSGVGSQQNKEPRFLIQLASCLSQECVEDYQILLKKVQPELPVRIVPFQVSRPITEVVSRDTYGLEQATKLVDRINQSGRVRGQAYRVTVGERYQVSLGQFPKVEQAAQATLQVNGLVRGQAFFVPRSTEQLLQYFRVQVPAFDDRARAVSLQKELSKADKRLANAFLVPNPLKK